MKQRPPAHWLGNAIGLLVAVYLGVSLASTLQRNYQLDQQISQMQKQITQLKSQQQQLNFELQYYKTSSYQQREAKSKLGLVEPGESEIILPTPSATPAPAAATAAKPKLSNFQQWINFLTGRTAG